MINLKRSPKLYFTNIDSLYHNTLFYSKAIRPWSFFEGKYLALEYRYEFVKSYFSNPKEFDYRNSNYYKLINGNSRKDSHDLYEGNKNWRYSNADLASQRFIDLIESIHKRIEIYNNLDKDNILFSLKEMYKDIIDFEKKNMVEIEYLDDGTIHTRKESEVYNLGFDELFQTMGQRLIGHLLPSAAFSKGTVVLKNGSHRLAIFKYFSDKKIFYNNFPIFLLNWVAIDFFRGSNSLNFLNF